MKIAVGLVLLGATLAGSAHAAAGGAPAAPSLSKDISVQSAPSSTKKNKSVHGKKTKPSDKVGAMKVGQKATQKPDSMTETPSESSEQSVQLRGVRG